MPILKRPDAEIHYDERGPVSGTGHAILLFAPGGMRSAAAQWAAAPGQPPKSWNDWPTVLSENYRVVTMDQRNAGSSVGAIEADHGWDTLANDQLSVMDHLGIDRFHVLGGCIGSTYCLKMAERAPDRVTAMVLQNPIGLNPERPTNFPEHFAGWVEELMAARDDLDADAVESFGRNLWDGDFVFGVSRDFVSSCRIPAIVLPGNDISHPAVIGQEVADLLPNAEFLKDWKGPDHIEEQLARVTGFLAKHTP